MVDAGVPLKPLTIRPESFVDKVAGYAGSEDIDLESEEFNRRFRVKSPDRRWAHDILQPRTMELMLSYSRFNIDLQGSHVIAYWHDRTFSCGDFGCALKVVTGILNNLPEYVFEEMRATHS
jgi:hypothetical protein